MANMKLTADRMQEIESSARELLQSIDLSHASTTSINWKLTEEIRQFIKCCENIRTELIRRGSDAIT